MSEEKYIADLKMMFASDGWKTFMSNVADEIAMLNTVTTIKDGDELSFRKGQLAVLSGVLNYEAQLEAVSNESAE